MNIIDKIKIIKGKVKLKKEGDYLRIINNSNKESRILILKKIKSKNMQLLFNSNVTLVKGFYCYFSFVDKKMNPVYHFENNYKVILEHNETDYYLIITIPPNSENLIEKIDLELSENYFAIISDHFKCSNLLVTPGYPKESNKYECGFVHTRMLAYKEKNIDVDLVKVNDSQKNVTIIYSYEGIDVLATSYNNLRLILQTKYYEKIFVHFFDEKYAQVFDACNLSKTNLYFFSHGADSLYWDWPLTTQRYFELENKISDELKEKFKEKDKILKRYNEYDNVKWIFVADFTYKRAVELTGINFKNYEIIPCLINEKTFKYEKKSPELRKKICVIRKFDNINSYSIDIVVKIIQELKRRDLLKELDISIYGTGEYHSTLLKPIMGLENINIYNYFLNHEEMSKVHKENGIALFPTRFDSQAVASCEAAMSGLVVLTSIDGKGVPQFIDPKIGTFCDTENYKEYADIIEQLYYDEKLFLEKSQKMHESVMKSCSYDYTIANDLKLFKEKQKQSGSKYKKQVKNPILTIGIAAYNVEKYLENCVFSLLNQKYHNFIEILIVNDGSKDRTSEIGEKLQKMTTIDGKSIVTIIDKKNGGHGSAINTAIKNAKGKYFKLLDGDDYFESDEFEKFIELLMNEKSDIVLNNYIEDLSVDATKRVVKNYNFMKPNVIYYIDDMSGYGYGFNKWGPLLSTATYKTDMLKSVNFKIDENCFYVDMEYNLKGYIKADTIVYYPIDLYSYYLGRLGQSVSQESYKKNIYHHETVAIRLISEFTKHKNQISKAKRDYLIEKMIIPMAQMQYDLIYNFKDKKAFISYDLKLREYPEFYNLIPIVSTKVKINRLTHGHFLSLSNRFENLLNRVRRK